MHPYLQNDGPMVIAHRGSSGTAPENTMLAFQQAVALGVDALEMDIHATADGVLIAAHDERLERVSDGRGFIKDQTLDELMQLDAGYHWTPDGGKTYPFRGQGHTLPRLETIFEAFPGMRLNIDIKHHDPAVVAAFAALIERHAAAERVMVGSFDTPTVRLFRRLCPDAGRAGSYGEVVRFYVMQRLGLTALYWGSADAFQIPELSGNRRVVTRDFVRAMRRRGVLLHVWTVNEIDDMRRLLEWGVDGIITDHPARLMRHLGRGTWRVGASGTTGDEA